MNTFPAAGPRPPRLWLVADACFHREPGLAPSLPEGGGVDAVSWAQRWKSYSTVIGAWSENFTSL